MAGLRGTDVTGENGFGSDRGVVENGTNGLVGTLATGSGRVVATSSPASNSLGIQIQGPNDVAAGNFVGTDPSGTRAVPNDVGIDVDGTAETAAGNLISGTSNKTSWSRATATC